MQALFTYLSSAMIGEMNDVNRFDCASYAYSGRDGAAEIDSWVVGILNYWAPCVMANYFSVLALHRRMFEPSNGNKRFFYGMTVTIVIFTALSVSQFWSSPGKNVWSDHSLQLTGTIVGIDGMTRALIILHLPIDLTIWAMFRSSLKKASDIERSDKALLFKWTKWTSL